MYGCISQLQGKSSQEAWNEVVKYVRQLRQMWGNGLQDVQAGRSGRHGCRPEKQKQLQIPGWPQSRICNIIPIDLSWTQAQSNPSHPIYKIKSNPDQTKSITIQMQTKSSQANPNQAKSTYQMNYLFGTARLGQMICPARIQLTSNPNQIQHTSEKQNMPGLRFSVNQIQIKSNPNQFEHRI